MSHPRPLYAVATLLLLAAAGGCRESDEPVGPQPAGVVVVSSDPQGATILVNDEDTGRVTPDTLRELEGERDTLTVRLDSAGVSYGYTARVGAAPEDSIVRIHGPLLLRCDDDSCPSAAAAYHSPNRTRFAASPLGVIFTVDGQDSGIYWPGSTENSYVAGGAAVIAGVVAATGDTVALGPYDVSYLAGRPAQELTDAGSEFRLWQPAWIVPPRDRQSRPTIRGIRVDQEIIGTDAVDDVVVLRLRFHNVTDRESYRVIDPSVQQGGITYESAYIGFALDADVGNDAEGTDEALDDRVSYVPDEGLAFIYDGDFEAPGFEDGWMDRPALIGLRVLETPEGTDALLTGWPRETGSGAGVDWQAGTSGEIAGLGWLSGDQTGFAPYEDERIGHAPEGSDDYRIAVSAGPLALAPGDSASLTIAVALAAPAEGTYVSGEEMQAGDPTDDSRALRDAAEPLVQRGRAAESLIPSP